jgi:cyanophycinase-like exopeptidase
MILYLFGGAETDQGQAPQLIALINQVLDEIQPRQLLHVPYARTKVSPEEEYIWGEGWVSRFLHVHSIDLLDARNKKDSARANNPAIFINGGSQRDLLYETIEANPELKEIIMSAPYVIGESAGAAVCGQFRRTYENNSMVIRPGLGLVKDSVIIAHYFYRSRQQELVDALKMSKANFGIGIDSLSGIKIDTARYPQAFTFIGNKKVKLVRNPVLK